MTSIALRLCQYRHRFNQTYGDIFALNSVGIDVKAGEFLTLLGPSGSARQHC